MLPPTRYRLSQSIIIVIAFCISAPENPTNVRCKTQRQNALPIAPHKGIRRVLFRTSESHLRLKISNIHERSFTHNCLGNAETKTICKQ